MQHTFVAEAEIVGELPDVVPTQMIIDEPSISSGDWDFARDQGGPLTQAVLNKLEGLQSLAPENRQTRNICIDTESQFMLLGQFPAIPGWHCDSPHVIEKNSADELFFVCSISDQAGGVSQTLFAVGSTTILVDSEHLWQSVHRQAERSILNRQLIADGKIVQFSMNTLHCPTACYNKGWRFWFRLAVTDRKPANKLLSRIQIYSPIESRD